MLFFASHISAERLFSELFVLLQLSHVNVATRLISVSVSLRSCADLPRSVWDLYTYSETVRVKVFYVHICVILVNSCAARVNPSLNATYGRIVFLDAVKIVDAATVIAEPMANGVDAQRCLLVHNVILEGMLGGSQIGQLLLDLRVNENETETER